MFCLKRTKLASLRAYRVTHVTDQCRVLSPFSLHLNTLFRFLPHTLVNGWFVSKGKTRISASLVALAVALCELGVGQMQPAAFQGSSLFICFFVYLFVCLFFGYLCICLFVFSQMEVGQMQPAACRDFSLFIC